MGDPILDPLHFVFRSNESAFGFEKEIRGAKKQTEAKVFNQREPLLKLLKKP